MGSVAFLAELGRQPIQALACTCTVEQIQPHVVFAIPDGEIFLDEVRGTTVAVRKSRRWLRKGIRHTSIGHNKD